MADCKKCIHSCVCKIAEACDGYVNGCKHFNGWISVKERSPEKDGNYLVFQQGVYGTDTRAFRFAKDGRKVDKYDFHREWKNVWYRYDREWGHITIDTVTHWMPLPEAPTADMRGEEDGK